MRLIQLGKEPNVTDVGPPELGKGFVPPELTVPNVLIDIVLVAACTVIVFDPATAGTVSDT